MKWWRPLVLTLVMVIPVRSLGAEVEADFQGSLRSRLSIFNPIEGDDFNLELRARPELIVYLTDDLSANATVRGQRNFGVTEASLGEGEFLLDRAYFDYQLGRWDLRIGRQAINFGQALIWNPVDLVDSNTPLDFGIVKQGVDTIRASYSLSSTASVLALLAFPDAGTISLLRAEVLLGSADLGFLVAELSRDDDFVLGFDVKGDLGVGYWVEAAYHALSGDEDYYQLVAGFDYSLPLFEQLYFALQYFRDSSGGTGLDDYDFLSAAAGRRFLARQYSSLIANLSLSDLTNANGSIIYNLEDQSFILTLGLGHYFFENLEVIIRASLLRGSGPGEYNPVDGHPLEGLQPTEAYELYLEWRF